MVSEAETESIFMEPIHLSSAVAAKQIINEGNTTGIRVGPARAHEPTEDPGRRPDGKGSHACPVLPIPGRRAGLTGTGVLDTPE